MTREQQLEAAQENVRQAVEIATLAWRRWIASSQPTATEPWHSFELAMEGLDLYRKSLNEAKAALAAPSERETP